MNAAVCHIAPKMHGFSLRRKRTLFNPLNAELNPTCYLLALLAHHFLDVSRIRVKSLTLRLLMSYIYIYIYIAPILDVSRSHNDAAQSVGLLWTSDQLVAETSDNTRHSQQTNIHALGGIRTHDLSSRAAPRARAHTHTHTHTHARTREGLVTTPPLRPLRTKQTHGKDIPDSGIRNHDTSTQAATDLRLRLHDHRDRREL